VLGAASVLASGTAQACGIIGFVGQDEKDSASKYLIEGLTILQNRGYDSAGLATISHTSKELLTTKFASKDSTSDSIEILVQVAPAKHKGDTVGIAHTRWATHGGKTDENAHPHHDNKDRIALVHNGTIENYAELKEELKAKGHSFRSQTDTEVIAVLIGSKLDEGMELMDAIHASIAMLRGTWGLCIISKDDPDQIIVARNGSPLVVGLAEGRMFVASEHTAFRNHTRQFIALKDGEVAIIRPDSVSLDTARIETAPQEKILLSPEPYPHWTIREINEQPEAINRSLNFGGRLTATGFVKLGGLDSSKEQLFGVRNLVIGACGTSLYAAEYGARLMRYLKSFDTVQVVDSAELVPEYFTKGDSGLLVISQSGETKDVHRNVVLAEQLDIPRFSVVNAVGSLIARTTKCGVYVNAGREQAVASTKAFVTQISVLSLIAGWFAQLHGSTPANSQALRDLISSLHRLPTYAGMTLKNNPQIQQIAQKIKNVDNLFVLGKGFAAPIAKEGALKIKEITYIHAEGFGGGSLKHGPFALLDQGTPVIMLILKDQYAPHMVTAAEEVRARGAYTIVITDDPSLCSHVADETIVIPSNGPLTALLGVIPLQLLAYHLAIARGIDPDKPKNLAKAVTVD
jgi:glucosamine--fructose-6-phosphate aminotransferase (isomerizing)